MIVANPLYDTVFKYLMEDERIARTILSALLKKDVVSVEMRRNEYVNERVDSLSVFRIDFGATIQEADGSQHLILIELQKTWLETETLRFRQYLGVQYQNRENLIPNDPKGFAIPMVTVYLLGHKVGDIEEPVLYVRRQSYDYDGRIVTKGLPDPFVDSLTHDSIIVQIPRLHGHVNNRLYRVLSIFDQTGLDRHNQHVLHLDEALYAEDSEMEPIIRRLLMAAADSQMRHKMNVEDEIVSLIEKRDTDLMLKTKELAEVTAGLKEKTAALQESHAALQESHAALQESNAALQESNAALQKSTAELQETHAALEETNAALQKKQDMLRRSIQMLLRANVSPEDIAVSLGKDLEEIRPLMN